MKNLQGLFDFDDAAESKTVKMPKKASLDATEKRSFMKAGHKSPRRDEEFSWNVSWKVECTD